MTAALLAAVALAGQLITVPLVRRWYWRHDYLRRRALLAQWWTMARK